MAARRYAITLHVDARFARRVPRRALTALARRVLASERVPSPADLSVVVTDDETVRELNRRYRGQDAPTDVLSFSLEQQEGFATPPESAPQLGEVVISFPTAARQAEEAGRGVEEELSHLLAHGILHLLGHDHESPAEAKAMRAREEALLAGLKH